jgi:large subunit ribosomal protein L29
MASKESLQLREMTDEELRGELDETQAQYRRLTFDHAIKGLDNPIALRGVRRDIARLRTEIRRRELANLTDQQLARRSKIRARRRRNK